MSGASVLALLLIAASPATGPVPGGHLLIVGGGEQSDELVMRFVELAGGRGKARIAVLPMASEEAAATGQEKAEELQGLGAETVVLNLSREEAETDSVARLFDGFTGVWFCGGDQSRLTPILLGTAALEAVQALYRRGGVVGGTSAGAAIMSDSMITGNQFRPGVDTAGYYEDDFPTIGRHAIEVMPGLGFLHGAVVDQHFITRERQNRLMSVILERPSLVGVGIDEGTAVEVEPDGRWRILGAGSVVVYDARRARITPPGASRLGVLDLKVQVLPAGSMYDPKSGKAALPPS
jgi:cyanophycinase